MGDDAVQFYLLQLVQLLRYESWAGGGSSSSGGGGEEEPSSLPMNMPPLARFLVDRACRSGALGNALFWVLAAEMQTDRALG